MITNEYETELLEVDKALSNLRKRKNELIELKNASCNRQLQLKANDWKIIEDTYLVVFSDDTQSWCLAEEIHVKDVDMNKLSMSAVVTEYMNEYGSQFCRVHNQVVRFEDLDDMTKNHSLYIVDRSTHMLIQHYFCSLRITPENINEYKQFVSDSCIRTLS